MEGEEGDFGPNFSGMLAQAPAPRGYPQSPRPPGVQRGFTIGKDYEGRDIDVFLPEHVDFDAPKLQQEINTTQLGLRLLGLLGPFVSEARKETLRNELAELNLRLGIRQAKDEAAKLMDTIEKDLKQFIDEFTPPELTPPGKNIEDPNLNVALTPTTDIDVDVDVA